MSHKNLLVAAVALGLGLGVVGLAGCKTTSTDPGAAPAVESPAATTEGEGKPKKPPVVEGTPSTASGTEAAATDPAEAAKAPATEAPAETPTETPAAPVAE